MRYRERVDQDEHDRLQALFVGKSVRKAGEDRLELSDGTRLRVGGNEGGCICGAGDYYLTELNECENLITNVEVDADPDGDDRRVACRTCGERLCFEDDHDNEGRYRLFVIAGDRRINLATFEGSDGNGYYGTGFWVEVEPTDAEAGA